MKCAVIMSGVIVNVIEADPSDTPPENCEIVPFNEIPPGVEGAGFLPEPDGD